MTKSASRMSMHPSARSLFGLSADSATSELYFKRNRLMADPIAAATMRPEVSGQSNIGFPLPPLSYGYCDLAPLLSETTLLTHHGKHHARYVETLNRLLIEQNTPAQYLEDVICDAVGRTPKTLLNNAAQAWNHGFFWESMSAQASSPGGLLPGAVTSDFGNMGALKSRFIAEGTGHFGSGWVWLVARGSHISIISTHDAESAVTIDGLTPLLVCDLWEHAYYLDYRQDRAAWLAAWWDRLANWQFAERQYAAALGHGERWRYPTAA